MTLHSSLPLISDVPSPQFTSVLRVLALFGLFLLPIQMRAGTTYVHPHALLHLLLDAGDNVIDHHHLDAATAVHGSGGDHGDHPPRAQHASSDLPTLESIQMATGGLVVSLVTVALLLIRAAREHIWPLRVAWSGRQVRPERPPPRIVGA